jgi:hypothetical protein
MSAQASPDNRDSSNCSEAALTPGAQTYHPLLQTLEVEVTTRAGRDNSWGLAGCSPLSLNPTSKTGGICDLFAQTPALPAWL